LFIRILFAETLSEVRKFKDRAISDTPVFAFYLKLLVKGVGSEEFNQYQCCKFII